MQAWFPKKRVIVASDDRYTVFSIYRFHDRKLREIQLEKDMVPIYQRNLEKLKQHLKDVEAQIAAPHNFQAVDNKGDAVVPDPKKRRRKKRKVVSELISNLYTQKFQVTEQIAALQKKIAHIESGVTEHDYSVDSCKLLQQYFTTRSSQNEFDRSLEKGTLDAGIVTQAESIKQAFQEKLANLTTEFVVKFFPNETGDTQPRSHSQHHAAVEPGVAADKVDESLLTCYNWSYDQIRNLVRPVRHYNYKRLNHFREYLRQMQGESKVYVPPECMENIKREIMKRYVDPSAVKYELVKQILKKMDGYTKFYEHSKYITRLLNKNYRAPNISAEDECILCQRFAETERPFEMHKNAIVNRKNFLSYPYCGYKLSELAGFDQYLPHFKLLKSTTLLILQDKIWELVCNELNWQAIRTVGRIC